MRVLTPNPKARVLVVGESNPHGSDPRLALYHRPRRASGNRLRLIMGLSDAAYLRYLDRANLCVGRWSEQEARATMLELLGLVTRSHEDTSLVLLGHRVLGASLAPADFGYFQTKKVRRVTVASLPHPSGLCRAWNEPGSVERARAALRAAAPWVPWGSAS